MYSVYRPDFEMEFVETKYYSCVFAYFIGLHPFNVLWWNLFFPLSMFYG